MLTRLRQIARSDGFAVVASALVGCWFLYALVTQWGEVGRLQSAVHALSAILAGLNVAYAVWRIRTKQQDAEPTRES